MASKQIRLTSTHKMALRMAIRMFEKKRMFIEAGELNDILEKSEGIKNDLPIVKRKELITEDQMATWPKEFPERRPYTQAEADRFK